MEQLIPSLEVLLVSLASAFRQEVHQLFCVMVAAWIVCLGRRTISRVWETTGQSEQRNHAAAFRLFSQAAWNWDEVCRLLLIRILATFVPGTRVWLVVDDTLWGKCKHSEVTLAQALGGQLQWFSMARNLHLRGQVQPLGSHRSASTRRSASLA